MFHRYAGWMIRLPQYTKAQQHQTTPSPTDNTQITKAVLKCAYIFAQHIQIACIKKIFLGQGSDSSFGFAGYPVYDNYSTLPLQHESRH